MNDVRDYLIVVLALALAIACNVAGHQIDKRDKIIAAQATQIATQQSFLDAFGKEITHTK